MTLAIAIAAIAIHPARLAAQGPPPLPPQAVGPVVTLEGELDVLFEDDDNRGRLLHFLNTDSGRVPLRFQGGPPDLPSGSHVRVTGNLADGVLTTTAVATVTVSTSRTLGSQNVLVILFNFTNNATQPYTPASAATVNGQVKNYYLETSYGQTIMNFTVAGWFTIPSDNTTCDYTTWGNLAETAATNAGFNIAAYDRRIFAFPQTSACAWWGMGNLGGPRSWINGTYGLRVVAHEQGHNFGDYHSRSMKCDATACTTVEYGDDRDVLGATGVVGHMHAYQKERLGWLNYGASPTIQTVSTSNDYWIENYETIGGSPKALKIWNPANSTYYYVESRAKMGFDSSVAAGVTIHSGAPTSGSANYQIDLAPTTSTWDSTLDIGQVFSDAAVGLSIQTISTSVDGAMVRVVFGTTASAPPTTSCVAAQPAVSLASSLAMKYTVTVTNKDGSTCAAAPFSFSASVPTGWSAAFSPAAISSLAPGASTSSTLTLTAPTGTSGTYNFSAMATNGTSGQSGSATASVTLAVTATPAPTPTTLSVTTSASLGGSGNNQAATIGAIVKADGAPAAGAAVTVIVTKPGGATTTLSATTAADGTASVKYSLKPKDPSGTYQVQTTATSGALKATGTTSFIVP